MTGGEEKRLREEKAELESKEGDDEMDMVNSELDDICRTVGKSLTL